MSSPRITYTPRPDAPPEAQVSVLASIYKLAINSHAKKRGRLLDKGGPDDGTESKEDSANEHRST